MPYNKTEQKDAAPMRRRPMRRRKKVCVFCADPNQVIDYKDANLVRKYISERGKIFGKVSGELYVYILPFQAVGVRSMPTC